MSKVVRAGTSASASISGMRFHSTFKVFRAGGPRSGSSEFTNVWEASTVVRRSAPASASRLDIRDPAASNSTSLETSSSPARSSTELYWMSRRVSLVPASPAMDVQARIPEADFAQVRQVPEWREHVDTGANQAQICKGAGSSASGARSSVPRSGR